MNITAIANVASKVYFTAAVITGGAIIGMKLGKFIHSKIRERAGIDADNLCMDEETYEKLQSEYTIDIEDGKVILRRKTVEEQISEIVDDININCNEEIENFHSKINDSLYNKKEETLA